MLKTFLIAGIFVLALVSADETVETSSSDQTSAITEAIKTTIVQAEIIEIDPPVVQSTKVPAPELTSAEVADSPSTTEPQPAAPIVTLTVSEFVKSSVQDILTTIQLTQNEVKPSVKSGQNSVNRLPAGTVSTIVNSAVDVKSYLLSIFLSFLIILLLI